MNPHLPIPESDDIGNYLACSETIDWQTPEIVALARHLAAPFDSDVRKAKQLYAWVRDEIPHSADARHETVTCRASDVLRHRTGICYAKAHLLAAMLRAIGIPSGMCYQVLRYNTSSDRLVVHGLNGIYLLDTDTVGDPNSAAEHDCTGQALPADRSRNGFLTMQGTKESAGRWIRVDPRGNKVGVDAQFSIEREQLAFPVDPALGEFTCDTIFAEPLPSIVECLRRSENVPELMANLPSTL